jgi:hypothetical protein
MKNQFKLLFVAIVFTVCGKAQIPNNGFELWTTTSGYQNPTDWGNLNAITKSYSVATCGKLSPGNPGNNYLVVRTVSVTGKGLIPGRVVSGKIDTVTYKAVSGYPFSYRPLNLSYNMQYMVALPSDTAFVSVLLTKWNVSLLKRDTVAFGISRFNAMAHTWFTNSTYLNYKSGDSPDSACIVISSSNNVPVNNSYMYVDNLQFNGNVIGIDEKNLTTNDVTLYPNPSKESVTINISQPINVPIQINIYDNAGKLVLAKNSKENKIVIDVSEWTKGIYIFEIKQSKPLIKKLVIN